MFEDPDISGMESTENSAIRPDDSTIESNVRKVRARQVGRLMLSYRLERKGRGRGGRLSQKGLLALMGRVKGGYEDYSHSTVGRWESGEILPTKERLEVFGSALGLVQAEIHGLIALAGLEGDPAGLAAGVGKGDTRDVKASTPVGSGDSSGNAGASGVPEPSYPGAVVRYCLTRFVLPGLVIAGVGYCLHSLDLSASWMFALYVVAIAGMVLAQGFLRLRRSNELRDLLFVSIFFILTAPVLQTPLVGTDVYGLYTIAGLAGTPIIYLVALIVNLLQAAAAVIVFDLLWRWQYSGGRGSSKAFYRAAWVAVPPLVLVYICNLLSASVATCFALLVVLPVVAGVLMSLLVLRDRQVTVSEWERRFLLQAAMGITIALTVLGGVTIMVFYLEPVLLSDSHHTTLFYSSPIDFNALGFPQSELMDRYRVTSSWSSLTTLVYMAVVLGGILIATIYRLGSGGQVTPGEATVPTGVGARSRQRSRRKGVDVRYRPGSLAGYRILQPVRSSAGIAPY
jgi:hypothetical protein